jgi:uncharacterized delta-60 repeat protein
MQTPSRTGHQPRRTRERRQRFAKVAVWRKTAFAFAFAFALAGMSARPALAASGDLDTTFGRDGKVTTNFTTDYDFASSVAIQADGRIVAVGSAGTDCTCETFVLARYRPFGALDPTFGGDGKVTTHFDGGGSAMAVAIQADGKIVVAGGARLSGRFALARYDPDGSLDPTFSGNGKMTTDFPGGYAFASGVAIQSDGKIVAAGRTDYRFALARYNPDGTPDPTFSGDGKMTTDFTGRGDGARSVVLQTDGKIVAAGFANSGQRFALARYEADGTLDPTFGADGKVTTNFTTGLDFASGVAIESDGKIVAAGSANDRATFALARYNLNGALDPTFGGDGKVTTNFTDDDDFASAMAIQADGKIVAAGSADVRFGLARYDPDGTLDGTFGGDGRVQTNFSQGPAVAFGVALQTNGKIVAAGGAGGRVFALARYL